MLFGCLVSSVEDDDALRFCMYILFNSLISSKSCTFSKCLGLCMWSSRAFSVFSWQQQTSQQMRFSASRRRDISTMRLRWFGPWKCLRALSFVLNFLRHNSLNDFQNRFRILTTVMNGYNKLTRMAGIRSLVVCRPFSFASTNFKFVIKIKRSIILRQKEIYLLFSLYYEAKFR